MKKGEKRPRYGPKEFTKIKIALLALGFEIVTKAISKRDTERFGLEPPDVERMKEKLDQTTFQKWFEGDYKISIHTGYDRSQGRFTKAGRIWIVASKAITERKYSQFFYRTRSKRFVQSTIDEVDFLNHIFNNRPISNETLIELVQDFDGTVKWVDPRNKRKERNVYENIPNHLKKHINALNASKKYYEHIVRKKNGTVNRARDLRKRWN